MYFKNNRTALIFLLAMLVVAPIKAQVAFGDAAKFNDGWLFRLTDDSAIVRTDYDDSEWRKLSLPHDWSIEGQLSPTLASCTGYLPGGIGWYRKHFRVEDNATRHYIYFEGVYNRSEVYLNGHLLGRRPNGYVSFLYDMTPYLKEGDNVLAVRVDHSRYADSRWYTGSGIYRDVWLVAAPDTHIAQWGVGWHAASLTDKQAVVAVDVEVEKHKATSDKLELKASLYDTAGKKVAQRRVRVADGKEGIAKQSLDLKVSKPHRWNLDNPYLYTLKTELLANGKRIDGSETKVGLRTLEFDANKGFALNGNWMKVKGVCLHHDAGVLGAVVPPEVWERRLNNLKGIGVNAIRMSHNPQAPVLYELCDRLGFLVMDEVSDEWEFPKRKWVQGWNVGTPSYDGTFDFFEEWIERDVTDMVRRDRNHTCIFLWSIGNEVDYPNDPYSHPVLDGAKINQPMFGGYKPDAPDAITSNAGWDVKAHFDQLSELVETFTSHGIRTSIFVGTDLENIELAAKTGTDRIELYTEPYATLYPVNREEAIAPFISAAGLAKNLGLGINAGHDLSLENLAYFHQNIPGLDEVSIGHALISDALYYGLKETIRLYKECLVY